MQQFGLVVLRQVAGASCAFGFVERQAVGAHDVLGQLVAAERLLALVDGFAVEHDGDVGDLGADLEQRDDLAGAGLRHHAP